MSEYRKNTMSVDSLWELYGKDFELIEGGSMRKDEASGLEFVYPEKFYKLSNGGVLEPDYMREDNRGLLKEMFCGDFAEVCCFRNLFCTKNPPIMGAFDFSV